MQEAVRTSKHRAHSEWGVVIVWLVGALVIWSFDERLDLAHEALLLVLTSAVAAVWSSRLLAVVAPVIAVQLFNFFYVPPRFTLAMLPTRGGDLLLLATVAIVSSLVAWLMARQRDLASRQRHVAGRATQLRHLSEALRDAADRPTMVRLVEHQLAALGKSAAVSLFEAPAAPQDATPDTDEAAETRARIPIRSATRLFGQAILELDTGAWDRDDQLAHARLMCDQLSAALERLDAVAAAAAARDEAQVQTMRSTLLAAISHDHRTPLAIILGAASSIRDQADRLSAQQQHELATRIVDEASQLARLTDNTLQLARLDAPGLRLRKDWQSLEELIGSVMRRIRSRDPGHRVQAHVQADLPLVSCDPILLVQLLDNLVDNALAYSAPGTPVEIAAHREGDVVAVCVLDRGPGIPPGMRERIFQPFQRGVDDDPRRSADAPGSRGAGVGLAVCRAIARVHDAELRLVDREGRGSVFELRLPVTESPTTHAESPP